MDRHQYLLSRFDTVVLRDLSPTDNSQVPAGATLSFFARGATVKASVTVGTGPTPIAVYDVGSARAGDNLQVNTGPQTLVVDSVTAPGTVHAHVASGSVTLAAGLSQEVCKRPQAAAL